jgi:hypothetical protein
MVQINLNLRNYDLRKNLDLRKILVHKMHDLRKIFRSLMFDIRKKIFQKYLKNRTFLQFEGKFEANS